MTKWGYTKKEATSKVFREGDAPTIEGFYLRGRIGERQWRIFFLVARERECTICVKKYWFQLVYTDGIPYSIYQLCEHFYCSFKGFLMTIIRNVQRRADGNKSARLQHSVNLRIYWGLWRWLGWSVTEISAQTGQGVSLVGG